MIDFSRRQAVGATLVALLLVASTGGYALLMTSGTEPSDATRPGAGTTNASGSNVTALDSGSEFEATRTLLSTARTPTGGYAALRPEDPSVYATHFNLRTANAVGVRPGDERATRRWLQRTLANDFENSSIGTLSNGSVRYLRDYRDAVVGLGYLNATPRNERAVVETVRSFRRDDGSYCFAIEDDGECLNEDSRALATHYALTTLAELDALESTRTRETRKWLLERWGTSEVFENPDRIGTAHRTVASLVLLDVDVQELDSYLQRVSTIEEQRSRVRRAMTNDSITLLQLHSYYRTLTLLGGDVDDFDDAMAQYLRRTRLPDGGFNIVGLPYSNARGTALGVELLAESGVDVRAELADGRLRRFLSTQSLADGGFAPAFRPRPTIGKTYYATEVRSTLGNHSVTPETRAFVERAVAAVRERGTDDITRIYQLTVLNGTTGADGFTDAELTAALDEFFAREDRSLRELSAAVRLAALVDYDVDRSAVLAEVRATRHSNGSYGPRGSTDATYYATSVLVALDSTPENRSATVEWIRANAAADGGYRFQNGNRTANDPDLYGTYLSVRTLALLDASPVAPSAHRTWVRGLRSPNGGFYPYANASSSPTLRYTYWAVETLAVLDSTANRSNRRHLSRTVRTISDDHSRTE